MSRRPVLRVLLTVVAFVALPAVSARATTLVCEKFEVGSAKWQKCLEDSVNDAFEDNDNQGGGAGKGDKSKGDKSKGDKSKGGEEGAQETGCDRFDVGTTKWQECIQDRVTGDLPQAPEGATCSEHPVGSDEWQDCIKGAATGGGLMPWIVVIPLGFMVLGMIVMFSRQAMRSRRMEGFSSASIGSTAGGWLIFMSLIEGSMGIGMAVAESRADGSGGGYFMAAVALCGTALILLVIGIVVSVKARKKRRVERTGSPGQATVVALSQTGTYINQNPQFMFELDVNVPGMAQFRTTQRATVPMYMVQSVGPGAVLPVKVDPSDPSEVVIDWSGVGLNRAATPAWGASPGATPPGTTPPSTSPGIHP